MIEQPRIEHTGRVLYELSDTLLLWDPPGLPTTRYGTNKRPTTLKFHSDVPHSTFEIRKKSDGANVVFVTFNAALLVERLKSIYNEATVRVRVGGRGSFVSEVLAHYDLE